jgi:hypothetical protein
LQAVEAILSASSDFLPRFLAFRLGKQAEYACIKRQSAASEVDSSGLKPRFHRADARDLVRFSLMAARIVDGRGAG